MRLEVKQNQPAVEGILLVNIQAVVGLQYSGNFGNESP